MNINLFKKLNYFQIANLKTNKFFMNNLMI